MPKLGGRQELCPACREIFSCTKAGDMHRVGDHALSTGPNRRRCLSESEMLAKGMVKTNRGVWMSSARESAA